MIAVCNEGVPVPEVFNVKVAVNEPVAPPSVAAAVPDSVTVAVSLSVTFTVPLPAVLIEAVLVGVANEDDRPFSVPSTNWSSVAVTVNVVVAALARRAERLRVRAEVGVAGQRDAIDGRGQRRAARATGV